MLACGAACSGGALMSGFVVPQGQLRASQRADIAMARAQAAPAVSSSGTSVPLLAGVGVALAAGAALVTPKKQAKQAVFLRAFENELGVQSPTGFWDPVGFTADGDVEAFNRRRATELKHGRISMLACMGYMTPEIIGKFPGYISPSTGLKYADIPNGLGAISKVPVEGWYQIIGYCLFVEYQSGFGKDWKEGRPGQLGWTALSSEDPAEKVKKLQAEIDSKIAPIADDIQGKFNKDLSEEFEYLRYCFYEGLRIESPVALALPTYFYEDVTLGGVPVDAGDMVCINIDWIHHDPTQWQRPDEFIPERFDTSHPMFKRPDGGPRHPMAFGPFLGGQRVCLGKSFAELMVRFVIAITFYHYEFELVDKDQAENKVRYNIAGMHEPKIIAKKIERNPLPKM